MPDEVLFAGRWFAVTAVDGAGLFDPTTHGLEPGPIGTACYRGYLCRYAADGSLTLRELALGLQDEPPRLVGAAPSHDDDPGWHYRELNIPVAFTGRLLIGDGDIPDRPYLNMGFWPAWMYSDVHELTFQAGTLLTATDRSAELAAVRRDVADTAARPAPGEETRDWISRTFSLTYAYSWPEQRSA